MLQIGKEMCDAAAAAFPNQNIKCQSASGYNLSAFSGGLTPLCAAVSRIMFTETLRGDYSLGLTPNRFFMQRNTVDANWATGQCTTYIPPDLVRRVINT